MKKINHQTSTYNLHPTPNTLTIGWLYPELMNIYGDIGNIMTLIKRCEWRGIKAKVIELNPDFDPKLLSTCNLLVMGGAQDKQQTIVNKDLARIKPKLAEIIENGTPGLYVCGGFQFLGNYYREADGTIVDGLEIFDLHTENPGEDKPRLIGNIAIDAGSSWRVANGKTTSHPLPATRSIVGFENHGGRTYLGEKMEPFGRVLKGFGNNENGTEGARYKNSFGTYMHGPILPKNPHFADYLIKLALKVDELPELDDSLEWQAHDTMLKKINL